MMSKNVFRAIRVQLANFAASLSLFLFALGIVGSQAAQANDDYLGATFIERMEKLELTKPVGPSQTLNVSGIVRDAAGKRAANVWVVLQTHPTMGVRETYSKVDMHSQEVLVFPNTYGRVKTDEQGRFRFHDVAIPQRVDFFEVIAASQSGSVGWTNGSCSVDFDHPRFDVEMVPATDVSGAFVTDDGKPIADALVRLVSIERAEPAPEVRHGVIHIKPRSHGNSRPRPVDVSNARWMSLRLSALQPTVRTDENGRFRIRALPRDCVGTVVLTGDDAFHVQSFHTATDATLKQYDQPGFELPAHYSQRMQVCNQPLRIVQVQNKSVKAVAKDPDGNPLSNTRIRLFDFRGYVTTDNEGRFQWSVSRHWIDGLGTDDVQLQPFGFLDGWTTAKQKIAQQDFFGDQEVTIQFIRGREATRTVLIDQTKNDPVLVQVVDNQGKPVSQASVETLFREAPAARGGYGPQPMMRMRPLVAPANDKVDPLKSDQKGFCNLTPPSETWHSGKVFATAQIDGHPWFGEAVFEKEDNAKVTVSLQKGWLLTGKVNAKGKPAPDIELVLSRSMVLTDGPGSRSVNQLYYKLAKTDSNGEYRFAVPANRRYVAYVNHVPAEYKLLRPDQLNNDHLPLSVTETTYEFEDIELVTEQSWPIESSRD